MFFEAKKCLGLSVLNYTVTSNHVHLLVNDTGSNVIAQSMQLIAGRTAQEYNQRKDRQGAFWEDRYHATAIEADERLHRCLIYIDLNMVRLSNTEASSSCSKRSTAALRSRRSDKRSFKVQGSVQTTKFG